MNKSTESARADAVAQLHEKKLRQLMEMKGCTRQEAEAALGPGPDGTTAKRVAETACAGMEFHAEQIAEQEGISKSAAMAKYLREEDGSSLYSDYTEAKLARQGEPETKAQLKAALSLLAKIHRAPGDSVWTAMNKALSTDIGRDLYRRSSEAA